MCGRPFFHFWFSFIFHVLSFFSHFLQKNHFPMFSFLSLFCFLFPSKFFYVHMFSHVFQFSSHLLCFFLFSCGPCRGCLSLVGMKKLFTPPQKSPTSHKCHVDICIFPCGPVLIFFCLILVCPNSAKKNDVVEVICHDDDKDYEDPKRQKLYRKCIFWMSFVIVYGVTN